MKELWGKYTSRINWWFTGFMYTVVTCNLICTKWSLFSFVMGTLCYFGITLIVAFVIWPEQNRKIKRNE
jgi:hypothetical protein